MSSSKFIKEFEIQDMHKMMGYYRSIFNYIFPLYQILLKRYSYSFYKELIFLIYEYLILILFIFSEPVSLLYFFIIFFIVSTNMGQLH